nr:AAA family ATPase [Pseudomonas palleroniana]
MKQHLQRQDIQSTLSKLNNLNKQISNINKHYIPILRGMRPLDGGNDLFLQRTQRDYFPGIEGLKVITGFDLYSLLAKFLLGQPDERKRVREYEKILGNEFFGGADITLIPQYGKDTIAVKIGDDAQFSIFDIGDGLQQVIIITSAAYLEQENSIFFVEEPESCLHPGLLRKLALFLLSHTNHQYIATTHSNHLLDLAENCEDILIHRVAKRGSEEGNDFCIQECTKDREILADLGVRASSVYLANSTIWVEGITDRKYLKVIMKKYLDSKPMGDEKIRLEGFLENYHYVFVEYQGGTLGHWGFDDDDDTTDRLKASRLCSDAFLIADGDILGKSERAQKLTLELKDRFHLLPGKEIENLLPANVLLESAKKIFERKTSKTKEGLDIEALSGILKVNLIESKQGIGFHLDRALGLKGKGRTERRVFADESGTINDKVKFCHQTIQVMNEIDWVLSVELIELCEKIYSHIDLKNQ